MTRSAQGMDSPGLRFDRVSFNEIAGRTAKSAHTKAVVFDKGHTTTANPETRAGLGTYGVSMFGAFRITERDKLPAREVVTARLLGDPAPGRARPPEPAVERERICTDSGPVLLTFGEYRRHYGEG